MTTFDAMTPAALAVLATERDESLFQPDYDARQAALADRLRGARVLVIGGAGSIGGSVTRLLAGFDTAALHVLDSNENGLVELTREAPLPDLRRQPPPAATQAASMRDRMMPWPPPHR